MKLLSKSLLGSVHPYSVNSISNSIANNGQSATYTFSFTCDTTVPIGGTLQITFPTQYQSGLGVASAPTCSIPCVIENNIVILTFQNTVLNGVRKNTLY